MSKQAEIRMAARLICQEGLPREPNSVDHQQDWLLGYWAGIAGFDERDCAPHHDRAEWLAGNQLGLRLRLRQRSKQRSKARILKGEG